MRKMKSKSNFCDNDHMMLSWSWSCPRTKEVLSHWERTRRRRQKPMGHLICILLLVLWHSVHEEASCFLLVSRCSSLQQRTRSFFRCCSKTSLDMSNKNLNHSQDGHKNVQQNDARISTEQNVNNIKRRRLLEQAFSVIGSVVLVGASPTKEAIAEYYGSPAMVKEWPEVKFLVPIYEFDKALRYLEKQLNSKTSKGLRTAQGIVENFLKGGIASNKNLFKLLCAGYIGGIVYDDPDIELVRDEQRRLLDATDAIVDNIVAMREPLRGLVDDDATEPTPDIINYIKASRKSMNQFLTRVPKKDIEEIDKWVIALQKADKNHNGIMELNELETMSAEYQKLYKEVGDFLST